MELALIKKEIENNLKDREVVASLLSTTFKGLTEVKAKEAMLEGMFRGFAFKDFLEKNIYAIPYGSGYSLVTSIDYSRKVGMRSGVVGVSAPVYDYKEHDGTLESCTITVKRRVNQDIGEYTAMVYFDEYTTGKNLWATKPRTMIAKVAEMHALRKACPEELSQTYIEEEMEHEAPKPAAAIDLDLYRQQLEDVKTLEELQKVWADMPIGAKKSLDAKKNELKLVLEAQARRDAPADDMEDALNEAGV